MTIALEIERESTTLEAMDPGQCFFHGGDVYLRVEDDDFRFREDFYVYAISFCGKKYIGGGRPDKRYALINLIAREAPPE